MILVWSWECFLNSRTVLSPMSCEALNLLIAATLPFSAAYLPIAFAYSICLSHHCPAHGNYRQLFCLLTGSSSWWCWLTVLLRPELEGCYREQASSNVLRYWGIHCCQAFQLLPGMGTPKWLRIARNKWNFQAQVRLSRESTRRKSSSYMYASYTCRLCTLLLHNPLRCICHCQGQLTGWLQARRWGCINVQAILPLQPQLSSTCIIWINWQHTVCTLYINFGQ